MERLEWKAWSTLLWGLDAGDPKVIRFYLDTFRRMPDGSVRAKPLPRLQPLAIKPVRPPTVEKLIAQDRRQAREAARVLAAEAIVADVHAHGAETYAALAAVLPAWRRPPTWKRRKPGALTRSAPARRIAAMKPRPATAAPPPAPPRYVELCFETPQDQTYFYRLPPGFPAEPVPGLRLRAPLGPRRADGYLLRLVPEEEVRRELAAKRAGRSAAKGARRAEPQGLPGMAAAGAGRSDGDALSAVREVLGPADEQPYLSAPLLELGRWMSRQYGCSLGEALGAMLPAAVKKHARAEKIRYVELLESPAEARRLAALLAARAPQQAVVLETLADCPGRPTAGELLLVAEAGESALRALARKCHLRIVEEYPAERVFMGYGAEAAGGLVLNPEQRAAVEAISGSLAGEPGAVHLIRGVTGSGKTEVYIRAAEAARGLGRSSIVLLPEIALTPQTCARFRSRFASLAVLHSHLTAGQRAEEWRRIRQGRADVVIGARSAVFAPAPHLGLLVVDEEHETSYKQDSVPRYQARDLAVRRAEIEGAVCVLGSATPSLESFQAARAGRGRLHVLSRRAAGLELPPVELIDTRIESREDRRFLALSRRLRALLGRCLADGGSAIIFLNRRGWATAVICGRCGFVARCGRCQVAMVYHRDRQAGLCHYCGAQARLGAECPECRGRLQQIGLGTERVAGEVARFFPEARVARLDSDVMARRTAHAGILADFREGKTNVLVGTQMVAKGLDFPRVTLVGMVNADTALNLPDFRAAERTFQLVSQVAGRAGRGPMGGRVAVQTAFPEHPAVAAAARHDYLEFAERELVSRAELFWPPYSRLLRVVVSARLALRARERAEEIAAAAGAACAELAGSVPAGTRAPELLGPAPCPLEKLQDLYRWHLLIKSPPGECAERLIAVLRRAAAGTKRGARAAIDADPTAML